MPQVKEFIERAVDVNVVKAAINHAARNGHLDVVSVLIQNGADVNAVDKYGETPLHCASFWNHVDVVSVLIQNGADVNAVDKFKRTVLHHAMEKDVDVDIAKVLIQNGADVNARQKDDETPLHRASFYGNVDVVSVLIQNGADVNAMNKISKWTPLHSAARWGHAGVAKVLIQNGTDVNAVGKDARTGPTTGPTTALHLAAMFGHTVLVLQLLCLGAVIDKRALDEDKTGLLGQINDRMNLLRAGKRPKTSLMSNEERRFMWNLAFSLTIQNRAVAFKAYYIIRSFMTFRGIFMADGYYNLDDQSSVWWEEESVGWRSEDEY